VPRRWGEAREAEELVSTQCHYEIEGAVLAGHREIEIAIDEPLQLERGAAAVKRFVAGELVGLARIDGPGQECRELVFVERVVDVEERNSYPRQTACAGMCGFGADVITARGSGAR
jgi:hypothetical protein